MIALLEQLIQARVGCDDGGLHAPVGGGVVVEIVYQRWVVCERGTGYPV